MRKTEHQNFTKSATCDYSSKMTTTNYLIVKRIIDKKPDYYTPDWNISKIEHQQKKIVLQQ
jgi:hypothetical protein